MFLGPHRISEIAFPPFGVQEKHRLPFHPNQDAEGETVPIVLDLHRRQKCGVSMDRPGSCVVSV